MPRNNRKCQVISSTCDYFALTASFTVVEQTLLLTVTKDGTMKIGLPPNSYHDNYPERAAMGWNKSEAFFFDPESSDLYSVTNEKKLVKGKPPTTTNYEDWLRTCGELDGGDWLQNRLSMLFSPDGKLWFVEKEKGNIYSGSTPNGDRYLGNAEHLGFNYHQFSFFSFTQDKTISKIISFEFLPQRGERSSENPEVITEETIHNRKSSGPSKQSFTFRKKVKEFISFTHEHGFTSELGADIRFMAGVPCIAKNGAITTKLTADCCLFIQEEFSAAADVEAPPGKAIRVVASVVKANLVVPYRAKVRTLYGSVTEIEGTWNGVTHYNLNT
ncbi:uncharacterized protein [Engystomops pustulosus]|uniref:uncharacterized protein n=1 Tax=Engystomops pustulosus TaxID=76066 RepID=UPI003AFB10C4